MVDLKRVFLCWATAWTMLGGCASGQPPPSQDPGTLLRVVDPKAQPWSSLKACVGDAKHSGAACATASVSRGGASAGPGQTRLEELAIELGGKAPAQRWVGGTLAGMDDPILHLLQIRPSWEPGAKPAKDDFVEVRVPFGFIRNRAVCPYKDDETYDVGTVSDVAVFVAYLDGRRSQSVDPPECLDN